MALISVIVPVYNVEAYIHRCVDSILKQTCSDFDLILVDDGSPDNCGNICDNYARQDARIHVLHQKNAGLSAARNAAIDWTFEHSDSQWLTFIDSDDWVHPEFLERLLRAAREQKVLVCACGYAETEGETPSILPELLEAQRYTPDLFYREHSTAATIACAKLYHRSCFEQVRYPIGKIHEDEFVTYRLLYLDTHLAFIPAPLYAYYINMVSITRKTWTSRHLDAWEAYEQQIAFFRERGDSQMHRSRYREYIENSYAQLRSAQTAPNAAELKADIRHIKKCMRALIRRAWKHGYIEFWMDYDTLYACAPIRTKLYRFYLEHKK